MNTHHTNTSIGIIGKSFFLLLLGFVPASLGCWPSDQESLVAVLKGPLKPLAIHYRYAQNGHWSWDEQLKLIDRIGTILKKQPEDPLGRGLLLELPPSAPSSLISLVVSGMYQSGIGLEKLQVRFTKDASPVAVDLLQGRLRSKTAVGSFWVVSTSRFPPGLMETCPVLNLYRGSEKETLYWGVGPVEKGLASENPLSVMKISSSPFVSAKDLLVWIPVFRNAGISRCILLPLGDRSLLGIHVELDG